MEKKILSKKDQKLKIELFEFLQNAIKHARENNIPKAKLASWLYTKDIALKDLIVNEKTFIPHILVEYKHNNKIKEFIFDLTKLEGRTAEEIMKDVQDDNSKKN